MSDIAVKVINIGKEYKIGERIRYNTLRESISNFTSIFYRKFTSGKRKQIATVKGSANSESINPQENKKPSPRDSHNNPNYIWSLKDVSFDVSRGEILGIIGRNGAGKSTLLKIISGVTEPTTGRIEIYGRIGSLLEVGTGFHPELTGRENIYLNGAIIGMKRLEIDAKYDAIVDFSEVEEFIDTPVKFYSSGMRVRLGFSVAAHLDPEILLLDEVLAVGDAAFQKKCLEKIKNLTSNAGKTILFISHDLTAINTLCDRTILLDNGKVLEDGITEKVLSQYHKLMISTREMPLAERGDTFFHANDDRVVATSIRIENVNPDIPIRPTSRISIKINYRSRKAVQNLIVQLQIRDYKTDRAITFLDSDNSGGIPDTMPPEGVIVCVTDQIYITSGKCTVDILFLIGTEIIYKAENATTFTVEPEIVYGTEDLPRECGMFLLDHTWSIQA